MTRAEVKDVRLLDLPMEMAYNRIESLKNIAQKGDSEAQYLLGICYVRGNGVEQSDEKEFWRLKNCW